MLLLKNYCEREQTMKSIILIILLLFNIEFVYSQNSKNYSDLNINDTVKVINKNKNYPARIYFFTNLNACNVSNINIETLFYQYGDSTEFVVFIDGANENDLESIKKYFHGGYKLIGDEFGIYKEYYKIKYEPLLLILDNKGIVKGWDNVKAIILNIDSVLTELKLHHSVKDRYDFSNSLKEINRIKVINKNKPLITSLFRNCIYKENDNSYILTNMRLPDLFFIDSLGTVTKKISAINFPNYHITFIQDMSWAIQDSLIYLYGNDDKNIIFQFYDIHSRKFSTGIYLSKMTSEQEYCDSYNSLCFNNGNNIINNKSFWAKSHNTLLNNHDTMIQIYNNKGKLLRRFGIPDKIYLDYKQSKNLEVSFSYHNGIIYTLQGNSNILKKWDINGKLLEIIELDLGPEYKFSFEDHRDEYTDENLKHYYNSNSFDEKLLIDKSNSNILFSFSNMDFPPDVFNFASDQVRNEVIINIYNTEGRKLNKHEIIMRKGTIPFHFEDNKIYTTEMNGNKLEIAIYEFIEKQ